MKIILLFFFSELLIPIISVIPLWNFTNSTVDLLETNSLKYTVYEKSLDSIQITLSKEISKNQTLIMETNTLSINTPQFSTIVPWDNIKNCLINNKKIYICPKGRFHVQLYQDNAILPLIPSSFSENSDDWELKCSNHYIGSTEYLFIVYSNIRDFLYVYKLNDNTWKDVKIGSLLYDYNWTDIIKSESNNIYVYYIAFIKLKDNYIKIDQNEITFDYSNINVNAAGDTVSSNIMPSSYSKAYFDSDNYNFYFMTYNSSYFNSGYTNEVSKNDYNELKNIPIINNKESPLDFYYNYTIKQINFTNNTRYIIYEIVNDIKNKIYHGIIDIILNQVIFNTDEEITSFKPYSSYSMLAITKNSAYKVCSIADNNGNCIEKCDSGNFFANAEGPNFCGDRCPNYILIPNKICINKCDENIFYSNDSYYCGFCMHINLTHPYKLLNRSGCLSNIPNYAYLYNEKYKLLKIKADSCNKSEDTYPLYYTKNNSISWKCFQKNEVYKGIFFDSSNEEFKLCYKTCLTCEKEGTKENHNCKECNIGYMPKPEGVEPGNCVAKCPYYYYNLYNQYRCVESLPCPQEANLYIEKRKKCIDDCSRDFIYRLQYNGKCYEKCPKDTKAFNNKTCIDIKKNEFTLIDNNINLTYISFVDSLEELVKIYSNEFSYTNYHVNRFKNKEFNSIMFKNKSCIKELSLEFPSIDFGNCYDKVKKEYNISDELITVIINKYDDDNNPSTSYSFYHPNTSEKLNTTELCKNDTVLIKENLLLFFKENTSNHRALLHLIEQGINIFDINNEFYNNLCYEYDFPTKKDIALQDRVNLFYPNISICDDKCTVSKIDLENKTAECKCIFNDISEEAKKYNKSNINKIEEALIENLFGDMLDFFDKSNIAVNKCFKKGIKNFTRCYGTYIIAVLLFLTIVLAVSFFVISLKNLDVYIYNITSNYLSFLESSNSKNNAPPLKYKKNDKDILYRKKKKKPRTAINLKHNNIKNLNIMISIDKNKKRQNSNIRDSTTLRSCLRLNHHTLKVNSKRYENLNIFNLKENAKDLDYKAYFEKYFSTPVEEMDYDDSIRKDKRKFWKYFSDILLDNQILLYTFISNGPFKTKTIKIIILLLHILLFFVFIALFINDNYISDFYNSENDENFFSFIPRSYDKIIYSTFASIIIEFLIGFFFVEEKKLKHIFLREKDNKNKIKEQIVILVNSIKNRFISFIITVFFIYIICLYYLMCFNSTYPNIQIEWIKSSIFLFIMRQILYIFQCLFETSLRFISFHYESEKIFKASKLFN